MIFWISQMVNQEEKLTENPVLKSENNTYTVFQKDTKVSRNLLNKLRVLRQPWLKTRTCDENNTGTAQNHESLQEFVDTN